MTEPVWISLAPSEIERLTMDGDYRITEDGQIRTVEGGVTWPVQPSGDAIWTPLSPASVSWT